MDRYLLSSQVLFDLISRDPESAARKWAGTVKGDEINVSVISIGTLRAIIDDLDNSDPRKKKLHKYLSRDARAFELDNRIINIDLRVAEEWASIHFLPLKAIRNGKDVELSDDAKLELATALAHNLTFVEKTHPYTEIMVDDYGLRVVDPYQ